MRWLRPIPDAWVAWHFTLFLWLMAFGSLLLLLEQLPAHSQGDIIGFANSIIRGLAPVILVSAAVSTTIVEGSMIFAERYLKHRYERGKEEGADQERQRWLDWLVRKQRADETGEFFDEPMPSEADRTNES